MKSNRIKFLIGTILCTAFTLNTLQTVAQTTAKATSQSVSISTTEEGKVKLKVVKKEGNDETNFEKTYDSHEEMMNDPELKKYGINPNGFGFGQSSSKPQFFFQNGPSNGFWNDDIKEMKKQMQEMMRNFGSGNFAFGWNDEEQMNLDSIFKQLNPRNYPFDMDSLRDIVQGGMGSFHFSFQNDEDDEVKVIRRAQAVITNATDEDKKLVGTQQMSELELLDLSFYPNPSDGRFDLHLKTKKNRPIQINIVDRNGNEVFNRVGTPENESYRLEIDLSKEEKGTYVLKMQQGKEALTKRIAIQ